MSAQNVALHTAGQHASHLCGRELPGSDRETQTVEEPLLLAEPATTTYDLAMLSIALSTVIFRIPITANQHSVLHIFQLRISLANLLVAAVCIAMWSLILQIPQSVSRSHLLELRALCVLALRVTVCTGVVGALFLARHRSMATADSLGLFFSLALALLVLVRTTVVAYRNLVLPVIRKERTVLIVGCHWRGQRVARQIQAHSQWNYTLIGFVDTDPPDSAKDVLGSLDSLEHLLMSNAVDEVIIALPIKSMYDEIQRSIAVCERLGIQSRYSTDLFETQVTKRRSIDPHDPYSVLLHMVHNDARRALKRLIDVAGSALGLAVLTPLLVAIAIAIKLTSDGPVLFRQQRFGLNKRLFTLYKFRSMVVEAELMQSQLEHLNETAGPAFKIRNDPRITGIGALLRKTSFDELPQLWNVLVGDMSLVGPRPLPMRDVSRFSEAWLMRRFSVPPGITGLWQVNGRSNTSFDRWISLDLDYIDHWSLWLDLTILARTLPTVLKGEGAV